MKTLTIYYYDGSVQRITPNQEPGSLNRFQGDWKGLAETVAGRHKKDERPYLRFDVG